jgi:hypothetical protein
MLPFVLVGCGSTPVVAYKPPQIPPLPPEIAKKQEVNLTDRLIQVLTNKSDKPSQPSQK